MDTYAQAVSSIIKEQQSIIGPVAIDQAKKVPGLKVSSVTDIEVIGNKKDVLNGLVLSYQKLFGNASVEVCKEAFAPYKSKLPQDGIPEILKN
jgi:hypothetical protein